MATSFAWFTVIVDGVAAIVFLRIAHVTAYRLLTIAGATLMGTTVLMLGAILLDNPTLASCGYGLGGVICFIGLALLVRSSKP